MAAASSATKHHRGIGLASIGVAKSSESGVMAAKMAATMAMKMKSE